MGGTVLRKGSSFFTAGRQAVFLCGESLRKSGHLAGGRAVLPIMREAGKLAVVLRQQIQNEIGLLPDMKITPKVDGPHKERQDRDHGEHGDQKKAPL